MKIISLSVSLMILVIVFVGSVYAENKAVYSNDMGVVTQKSQEETTISFPDVSKTPSPAGPVPIPYPNISKSSDTAKGTKKVKTDGNPINMKDTNFTTSDGDEPGSE